MPLSNTEKQARWRDRQAIRTVRQDLTTLMAYVDQLAESVAPMSSAERSRRYREKLRLQATAPSAPAERLTAAEIRANFRVFREWMLATSERLDRFEQGQQHIMHMIASKGDR